MNMQPGTATLDQVNATQFGVECYAKWIAPYKSWQDDMHDDLIGQGESLATIVQPQIAKDSIAPATPVL